MKIVQRFIPKSNDNRSGYWMDPDYITLHTTRNLSKGADALMHSRFLNNDPASGVSWHFTVDSGPIIYQHLPLNENGWHSGDGSRGTGNRRSIGIEICENSDGDFDKAVEHAIWLVKYLMKKCNIPLNNVEPHQRWSGKNCPKVLLPKWRGIINMIKGADVNMSFDNDPMSDGFLERGETGEIVREFQAKMTKVGYKLATDGSFGPATERMVKKFQKENGLVVDGYAGPKTWEKLVDLLEALDKPVIKDHFEKAEDRIFDDIPEDSRFYASTKYLQELGLINGYPNGDFGPKDPIKRGDLANLLHDFIKKFGLDVKNDE